MNKSTIKGIIYFILIGGLLFLLFSNLHLEFFSGTESVQDNFTMTTKQETKSVSLVNVMAGKAQLNVMGWLTALLVIAGIPGLIGYIVAKKSSAKNKTEQPKSEPSN